MHFTDAEDTNVLFLVNEPRTPDKVRAEDRDKALGKTREAWMNSLSELRGKMEEHIDE